MARTSWLTLALVAGTLAPSTALAAEQPPLALRHIWVYTHPNLATEAGLAKAVAMAERAARGGYTGIVGVTYTTWSNGFRNLEKYAQAARAFERDHKAAAGKAECR